MICWLPLVLKNHIQFEIQMFSNTDVIFIGLKCLGDERTTVKSSQNLGRSPPVESSICHQISW